LVDWFSDGFYVEVNKMTDFEILVLAALWIMVGLKIGELWFGYDWSKEE